MCLEGNAVRASGMRVVKDLFWLLTRLDDTTLNVFVTCLQNEVTFMRETNVQPRVGLTMEELREGEELLSGSEQKIELLRTLKKSQVSYMFVCTFIADPETLARRNCRKIGGGAIAHPTRRTQKGRG